MIRFSPSRWDRRRVRVLRQQGFTLTELLILLVIIGVFTSLVISGAITIVRRERINAVALGLAGWLEEVRNISAKKVGNDAASAGCVIILASSANDLAPGAVLATVSPVTSSEETNCAPRSNGNTSVNGTFRLPPDLSATVSLSVVQAGLVEPATVTYTPRGIWTPKTSASGDLTIKLLLDGGGPLRCVRLSESLAFVDLGQASATTVSASCTDFSSF